jgi:hypothetical protein
MDVLGVLQTQFNVFLRAPFPAISLLALGAIPTWWFSRTVYKGEREALKANISVTEERVRLAADKAIPVVEKAVETDEKGNVKPPAKSIAPETPAEEQRSDQDELH